MEKYFHICMEKYMCNLWIKLKWRKWVLYMCSFKRRKQVITDVIPVPSPLVQAAASLLLSFSSFIQLLPYSPLLGLFMKCIHWCSHRFAWFSADLFFSLTIFSRVLCFPTAIRTKELQLKWFTYGHIKHHISGQALYSHLSITFVYRQETWQLWKWKCLKLFTL